MTAKEAEPEGHENGQVHRKAEDGKGSGTSKRPSGGLVAGLVLAAVVVIVAIALILGFFGGDGKTVHPYVQSLNEAENIACSKFMAVGQVVSVAPSDAADRIIVTFAVEDPIKPTEEQGTVELDILDPAVADSQNTLQAGDHVLLEVPLREDHESAIYRGTRLESRVAEIKQYLDEAAETECPPYFQEGGETVKMEDPPGDAARAPALNSHI